MARLQMMCAILGPYNRRRWVSLRLSLKDLMFFVDELPNLVDLMEDGRGGGPVC